MMTAQIIDFIPYLERKRQEAQIDRVLSVEELQKLMPSISNFIIRNAEDISKCQDSDDLYQISLNGQEFIARITEE